MDEDLITVAQAAELLNCSRPKIYNLHKDGRLDMRKIGWRSTRITRASINRLLADPALMRSRPAPAPEKPRRLRTAEAAEYIGVSPWTLWHWRAKSEGPPYLKYKQTLLYDLKDLDAWIAAQTQGKRA